MIGCVPQRIAILPGTLLENIALGDLYPDEARVSHLCKQLGLEEFIRGLPDGLQTRVSEDGSNLSGGQRQRIAIARVLYRDPQVIILDEPSSALDPATETLLVEIIREQSRRQKTIVVASHYGEFSHAADKCYTFHDGRVSELNPVVDPIGKNNEMSGISSGSEILSEDPKITESNELMVKAG